MEKVVDLTMQYKIRGRPNGKNNLLVREIITLEVDILVILATIVVIR